MASVESDRTEWPAQICQWRATLRNMHAGFVIDTLLIFMACMPLNAQDPNDLHGCHQSFNSVVGGMTVLRDWKFGSGGDNNVKNTDDLARHFCVYGIAGMNTINHEWEKYPGGPDESCGTFNTTNWVFAPTSLQLTATLDHRPLKPGNIHSGQITTKDTFCPAAGYGNNCGSDTFRSDAYAFEIDMKFPVKTGAWPAFWLYTKRPGKQGICGRAFNCSELDMIEFFIEQNPEHQDEHDPTFNTWGPPGQNPPAVGKPACNKLNRYNIYDNGTDFSTTYHRYQMYWTRDHRYTFLDGVLLQAIPFHWEADGPAQVIANFAFGTSQIEGMKPASPSEFPNAMDITAIKIWGKQ